MIWQDIVITLCLIAFSYALLPQVYQGFKQKRGFINLQTSGITFAGMYTIAIVYFTLGLTFSTVIALITGTIWLILFVQRIIYKN